MSGSSSAHSTQLLPVLSLILGAGLWGTYWWPLHFFTAQGFGGPWLIAITYLLLAAAGSLLAWRRGVHKVRRGDWRSLFWLALFGGWTNVAFMMALFHGQVVIVLLLFYLSPVWAVLLARVFLKEAIGWRGALAVLLAVSGTVLVVVQGNLDLRTAGLVTLFFAVSSGFAFALSNVVLRGASLSSDLIRAVAIWWGCAIIALAFAVNEAWPAAPHWPVLFLPLFAWFWVGFATASTIYGVSRLPIRISAVIMPIEVIVGAVSAWIWANQSMSFIEIAGAALILSASLVQLIRQKAGA
ncbi:EamA family transporter [Acidithiobacillus sp. CV18-2]|uniref:EamA family transporter n=1 Tax=Igneacidithiobacillus copahuensis TaxID=2724909 RepID=A0AAE2YSI7_9PROT|nr:EamA family transporter [Acidithiobacillus sp. CV18-3]MBU2757336.1 EamA family transporter [Acidithiobacillus sp. BN09-2]MBU2776085.1 EamA family transporter [Acidithiobacillus sp. CV18-2]MBU2789308.1 EamA family transporter [Igneacidithiobacillus copahuensis]MBU2795418.1 EamA family transporter [Acidithiobacillus sp. VAN18-2]MBU2800238.1 EamA family transporter [Acidithiobacillus sp. VAN18-4]UTV82310.1 DMT family transporter [Acidithiobacillus sp. YTS05]